MNDLIRTVTTNPALAWLALPLGAWLVACLLALLTAMAASDDKPKDRPSYGWLAVAFAGIGYRLIHGPLWQ